MSTDEKIHPITGDISESDKDLEQEKAKGTLEGKTKSDPTTTEQIEHTSLRLLMQKDEGQTTQESCKEQEGRVAKERGNSSVSAIENREVKDESASKPFQEQDPVKKEKSQVQSTIPAETEEENCETEIASKIIDEVNHQRDERQTTSEPSEDSKEQENGNENGSKPTEDAKDLGTRSRMHPNPTTTIKEEADRNNAETSEDVKIRERFIPEWFHFPRFSSRVEKSPKTDVQEMNSETKEKHYDIRHVNGSGSYLLAIGLLMFVCIAIILGGFFWRIGYAVGGNGDSLNATDCPTPNTSSNDSNVTNHSVLKVLKKMWRHESNDLFLTENNVNKRS